MVTTKPFARLGNQMFMIAAVIGYAKKHGLEYHIPPTTLNHKLWPPAFVHLYNRNYKPNRPVVKIAEESHAYQELPFKEEWRNLNIELSGYWQSEKYFEHYRGDILKAFEIPYEENKSVVAIHVRRGDYLNPEQLDKHPVCGIGYYSEAISVLKFHYTNFLVFSDDMQWSKANINTQNFPDCLFGYSEGRKPLEDLALMSSCEHQICANSSYSWWGAWLNQNPDKMVVFPKTWFGPGNSHLETKDIYPANSIIT